jgi:endonuclease YncB( thermonuclease family)
MRPQRRPAAGRIDFTGAIALIVLGLCAALPTVDTVAAEPAWRARCVGVLDGDSIEVLRGGRSVQVRLSGIDAPERGQAFSSRAKQALGDLVSGREVEVAVETTDAYGRLVARVRVGGVDTSVEMVRRGLAWHYRRYSDDPALAGAEAAARVARVGLWSDPGAVPPWSYRHASSTSAAPLPGAAAAPAASGPLRPGEVHGNTSSRLFHVASCPNFGCRNCTARFPSAAAAQAAGYRPAGCCHPR